MRNGAGTALHPCHPLAIGEARIDSPHIDMDNESTEDVFPIDIRSNFWLPIILNTLNTSRPLPTAADRIRRRFDRFLHAAELAGLVLIGLATSFAMGQEAWKVVMAGGVSLTDLLLMFLYLEVLAMTVRYLRLGRLPVRFPLYIAMTSLARDLILRGVTDSPEHMLMTTLGIVLLAVGVLILRFGQHRFPAEADETDDWPGGR